MQNKNNILNELLEIEAAIFDKLNAVIADVSMADSDVDALSLQYEKCIKAVLDYSATTLEDVSLKCDFIFRMIGRSFHETDLLEAMKASLLKDVERLSKGKL